MSLSQTAAANDAAILADKRLRYLRACENVAKQNVGEENPDDQWAAVRAGRELGFSERQTEAEIARIRRAASTQTIRQLVAGFDAESAAQTAWRLHVQQLGVAQSRTRNRQNQEMLAERGYASTIHSSLAYTAEAAGATTTPEGGPIPKRIVGDKSGLIDPKRLKEFLTEAQGEKHAAAEMKPGDRQTLRYGSHVASGLRWAVRARLAGGGAVADKLLAEFAKLAAAVDWAGLLAEVESRDVEYRGVILML